MKAIMSPSFKDLSLPSSSSQLPSVSTLPRKDWQDYYLALTELVATRATCDRLHVGCILVREGRVIATGYNGSLPGQPHCDDVGHDMDNGHCVRTVHAEINAVLQCAKFGVSSNGATAYISHEPCSNCQKLMRAAGVEGIYYLHSYPGDSIGSDTSELPSNIQRR